MPPAERARPRTPALVYAVISRLGIGFQKRLTGAALRRLEERSPEVSVYDPSTFSR
jgi:hypothetical protein